MIIVDRMFPIYMCVFLCIIVYGAEISVHTSGSKYHKVPNLSKSISDRFVSFSVKTCGPAYVGLFCGNTDSDPLYRIVIDEFYNMLWCQKIIRSYIWIDRDIVATKSNYNFQNILNCYTFEELYITWNETTITIGLGLEVNGLVFLTWTSSNLQPIQNVGICTTLNIGHWIFYTSEGIPTMTEEATSWPKNPIARDLLLSTDVTRYPLSTITNNMITISQGTSIRPSTYILTRQTTMKDDAIGLPQTTRPNERETTSDDSQSRTTNVDSVINNYTATSTSTVSTTITESSPISTSTVSTTITESSPISTSTVSTTITKPSPISTSTVSTTITESSPISTSEIAPCGEQCTPTCTCSCPKVSVTPNSNFLVDQLRVDRKTLSSYKRRQQSATDPRKSSFYIGCVGITVFVVFVGFIVLLDFLPRA